MFSGEFDPMVSREDAARYFDLIGMPDDQKRHVWALGGHFIPRDMLISETLAWSSFTPSLSSSSGRF